MFIIATPIPGRAPSIRSMTWWRGPRDRSGAHGFGTHQIQGRSQERRRGDRDSSRRCGTRFPRPKLRYDPQAIYSPATAIRIGKAIEALDLEYYEDPCWGNIAMARVRERVAHSACDNMASSISTAPPKGLTLKLGRCDPGRHIRMGWHRRDAEAQGSLRDVPDQSQFSQRWRTRHRHRRLSASCGLVRQSLPHALDTHATELAGDVVKPGVIGLTARGTMQVPDGRGPWRRARSGSVRGGGRGAPSGRRPTVYAEDLSRGGVIPVKSMW